jgi:imidazolonepropionase-like amidohydrolase
MHLFRNCRVLDVRGGVLRDGVEVKVADGQIAEVGPALDNGAAQVLDLGGRTLMPGLIDCHVHITASHVRFGLAASTQIPASLVTAHAGELLDAMLMRGFTSVRDAGGADLGHRRAVEEGLFRGPRLFISGRAISQTGGHGDFRARIDHPEPCACSHMLNGIGRIADGVPAVRHAVRDEIRLGADQIKVMASGGVASVADPIHFLQYSVEELEAFVDEAARASTYVMAHAYTAAAIRRCIEAGVRTIEHGNLIDTETADLMATRGAYLVPTLSTYFALAKHGKELGFPAESLAKLNGVLDVGARSLEIARDAGVKMALGTDLLGELQAYQGNEFNIRSEVLPADELIRSATVVGAEVLRQEGRLGEIVPGAVADLIAVDGNPLEDVGLLAGQGEHLALIMKDGVIMKQALEPAS